MSRESLRLRVTGVVQGVGFRPFVHRLAAYHGLAGWIRNTTGHVQIEVEGDARNIDAFIVGLRAEAPPLARIEHIEPERRVPAGLREFRILPSAEDSGAGQPISPDVALCATCERELFDPANRRYRYPFITCTDCGPRFTVIEAMPYDRVFTSMRAFVQCAACLGEYESPGNRRFHSETNSCPDCGPKLWLEDARDPVGREPDVLASVAQHLQDGAIVAIRGLGGFHLAADATNDGAVERLRERKRRETKPFAAMVRTLDEARALGVVEPAEARLLLAPERPIVVLRKREPCGVAASVAPGLDTVGVMLAYTPIHHLLLEQVRRPLVMTSGNHSEEPIATGNAEARARLGAVADVFLLHDREIVSRYDDSLIRLAGNEAIFLRRARGYAPLPLCLPIPSPKPLVAVGPQLKSTFTLVQGDRAYISQHIGDLDDLRTVDHFHETLRLYRHLFHVDPTVAVRDAHPDYLSTRFADELSCGRVMAVQHHHAHVAAVIAEHGLSHPVVGVAYDGAGYGDDGNIWGGEVLVADLCGYRRAAHLRYAPLPGGDLGARRPWRAAAGYLSLAPELEEAFRRAFSRVDQKERQTADLQAKRRLNAPLTSAMGRLFDAAAAILGLRQSSDYEGQAAMELEALAGTRAAAPLPFPIRCTGDDLVLDPLPLLASLGESLNRGQDPADLAAAFHESVAASTAALAIRVCRSEQIDTVVLSGGVFQNARLLDRTRRLIAEGRVRVLLPRKLPPNDGAVSYGQAAIAGAQLSAGRAPCA